MTIQYTLQNCRTKDLDTSKKAIIIQLSLRIGKPNHRTSHKFQLKQSSKIYLKLLKQFHSFTRGLMKIFPNNPFVPQPSQTQQVSAHLAVASNKNPLRLNIMGPTERIITCNDTAVHKTDPWVLQPETVEAITHLYLNLHLILMISADPESFCTISCNP